MTENSNILLPEYYDEFIRSEFIPVPSVEHAVEILTETAVHLEDYQARVKFYTDIINALRLEIAEEMRWYDGDPVILPDFVGNIDAGQEVDE